MSSNHDEVRCTLQALRKKMPQHTLQQDEDDKNEISAFHFSSCLYGLRNCSNDGNSALYRDTFSADQIGKSLEGLHSMIANDQVKKLLRFLSVKIDTCQDKNFTPTQIAQCLKG